jgi:hypothetical protein
MSDTVEILLDGPEALSKAQALLAKAAPECWKRKKPLRLTLTTQEKPNTNAQKAYWSGPVLNAIASQARWNGRQYPPEFWREYFRRRYLLRDEFLTPDGEILPRYWSTADRKFSTRMMAEFIDKVLAEASQEWGVVFK